MQSSQADAPELDGATRHLELVKELQERWKCDVHTSKKGTKKWCYRPSGSDVFQSLSVSHLSFWAIQIVSNVFLQSKLGILTTLFDRWKVVRQLMRNRSVSSLRTHHVPQANLTSSTPPACKWDSLAWGLHLVPKPPSNLYSSFFYHHHRECQRVHRANGSHRCSLCPKVPIPRVNSQVRWHWHHPRVSLACTPFPQPQP